MSATVSTTPDLSAPVATTKALANVQAVRITDVDMPIGSMIVLILKFAIASIPAMLLLFILGAMLGGVFAGLGSEFLLRR